MRLSGSEDGLQAADGPLPWPRTRDDVRGTTQTSISRCLVVDRSRTSSVASKSDDVFGTSWHFGRNPSTTKDIISALAILMYRMRYISETST